MANNEDYAQASVPERLRKEIVDDAGITTAIDFIDQTESPLNTSIHFVAAISAGERTALDALMAAHAAPSVNGLLLTSDKPLDSDGLPVAANDGVASHTITIDKVDANGTPLGTGTDVVEIHLSAGCPVDSVTVTLVAGTGSFVLGPEKVVTDVDIICVDDKGTLAQGNLTVRFAGATWDGQSVETSIAEATDVVSTTSSTYVLTPGMTLTPGAGTYIVEFSGTYKNNAENSSVFASIYSNGVLVAASEREFVTKAGYTPFYSKAKVTVAAAQAIEGRYKRSSSTAKMRERQLLVTKVA